MLGSKPKALKAERTSQDAAAWSLTLSTLQVPLEVLKISPPFSVHLSFPVGIVSLRGASPPDPQLVVLVLGEHPISK